MTQKITSAQPEPVRQRIYGSTPVSPLGGPSDQPQVLPNTKVYGVKPTPTVRVCLEDGNRELVIEEKDFNVSLHELVDA